jgi:uncharacterized protein YprB with RNaseH-like and TPR domain
MSSTLDRLRRLTSLREQRSRPEPDLSETPDRTQATASGLQPAAWHGPLHELVPGVLLENEGGVCFVSTRAYRLAEPRGAEPLGSLLALSPALFHTFHPAFGLGAMVDYRQAAFIDTETTGLGGGAGVYCFMVGVGAFERYDELASAPGARERLAEPTHFVVRQFFMRNPAEERAVLVALAALLGHFAMTVTFNGRTFDLPLLRARYSQNRRFLPATCQALTLLREDRPHLDLLHPSRRLWRRRLQSCRLIHLEQRVLGLQRSEDDVPGHLIPALYMAYMRSGDAGEMRRVFYHNCEDILTMVGLAERLSRAYGETTAGPRAPLDGQDLLALGRVYERSGQLELAEAACRRALETVRSQSDRAELFARLGRMLKKQGRWQEASDTWQLWLSSVPGADPAPYVELAKYYEWQLNDLEQAEMWTAWALHTLRSAGTAHGFPGARAELEHRLARLQRRRLDNQDRPGTAPTRP